MEGELEARLREPLDELPDLRLLVHEAASVAGIVGEGLRERGGPGAQGAIHEGLEGANAKGRSAKARGDAGPAQRLAPFDAGHEVHPQTELPCPLQPHVRRHLRRPDDVGDRGHPVAMGLGHHGPKPLHDGGLPRLRQGEEGLEGLLLQDARGSPRVVHLHPRQTFQVEAFQRRRVGHRHVHVHAAQGDRTVRGPPIQVLPGGVGTDGPSALVPVAADDPRPLREGPGASADAPQEVLQGGGAPQVQGPPLCPHGGQVGVAVHEAGQDRAGTHVHELGVGTRPSPGLGAGPHGENAPLGDGHPLRLRDLPPPGEDPISQDDEVGLPRHAASRRSR